MCASTTLFVIENAHSISSTRKDCSQSIRSLNHPRWDDRSEKEPALQVGGMWTYLALG